MDDEERILNTIELDWTNGKLIFSCPSIGKDMEIKADQTDYDEYLGLFLKACTILR